MELMVADLDASLVPTYGVLGAAYETLLALPEGPLDDALATVGADRDDLIRLQCRYSGYAKLQPETRADCADLSLLACLLHRGGRSASVTRPQLEAALFGGLANSPRYVVPFWVPAVAGFRANSLFFPLVAPRRSNVLRAYMGLVQHIRSMSADKIAASELSCTAILWRIAALLDGLEPGDRSLYEKMNAVRHRVVRSDVMSEPEKRLWGPLQKRFSDRRHVLSHLIERDGECFETAADYAISSKEELLGAATALSFAVLQHVADDFEGLSPRMDDWTRVWSGTEWIEDHL